jgi:hypothetical protein
MATIIDPGQAQSLIQEFRTKNQSSGEHAWKTPDGQHLNGFFLDRDSLQSILNDEDNKGVHIHFAKNPDFAGKQDNVNTLVYSGTKPETPMFASEMPCPPWCG